MRLASYVCGCLAWAVYALLLLDISRPLFAYDNHRWYISLHCVREVIICSCMNSPDLMLHCDSQTSMHQGIDYAVWQSAAANRNVSRPMEFPG